VEIGICRSMSSAAIVEIRGKFHGESELKSVPFAASPKEANVYSGFFFAGFVSDFFASVFFSDFESLLDFLSASAAFL
jgi:hypothetical protein